VELDDPQARLGLHIDQIQHLRSWTSMLWPSAPGAVRVND